MLTRRNLLSKLAATTVASALFGLLGVGYAAGKEVFGFKVRRYRVQPEGWPVGRPLRIAMLTDFHANASNVNASDIASIVSAANALAPDVMVLLGDYCSQDRGSLTPEEVASALRRLSAPLGVFSIQGNHDWRDDRPANRRGHGPTRTESALVEAGLGFLENRAVPIGNGKVWIAGIESEATPEPRGADPEGADARRVERLRQALRDVPADAKVVLLAHEPDLFALDIDPRAVLTLSGHTHGGQMRVLGWSPWIPSRYGLRYAYGHVVERARHLVVSAGLGSHFVAGYPLRIGVPPELVVVEVSARGEAAA